jgi:hypothetical protein
MAPIDKNKIKLMNSSNNKIETLGNFLYKLKKKNLLKIFSINYNFIFFFFFLSDNLIIINLQNIIIKIGLMEIIENKEENIRIKLEIEKNCLNLYFV